MADVMRFRKDIFDGVESYKVYSSSGISQGHMAQWDMDARVMTTALLVSGSHFIGVTDERNPVRSLGTADAPLTGGRIRVKSQGIVFFTTTNGETYSHFDPVYQGANQETVTKVSAGPMIGRVHLPLGNQVTGNGTNTVDVMLHVAFMRGIQPSSAATAV